MTPYPHPTVNLDIFRKRLGQDIAIDEATFIVACAEPVVNTAPLPGENCQHWAGMYNTRVDVAATGALTGEIQGFLYNRLDIAQMALPAEALNPFLKGAAVTSADLLDAINARWRTAFLPEDILATPLPTCDCACGPVGFTFAIAPSNLIYTGSLQLYVTDAVALNLALTQPFLPAPVLPVITP